MSGLIQGSASKDSDRAPPRYSVIVGSQGVWVAGVEFGRGRVRVDVALRRRRLVCPECGWFHGGTAQRRPSTWRAPDFGIWRAIVRCQLRRLDCRPCGRVVVEQVPFARHRARSTRDFDDVVAWLAQRCDKTAITELMRINWRTVGTIIERVIADQLDDTRLDGWGSPRGSGAFRTISCGCCCSAASRYGTSTSARLRGRRHAS